LILDSDVAANLPLRRGMWTIAAESGARVLRAPVVLLVQPELDDREMYAECLQRGGLRPIPVPSGRHALRLAPGADMIVTELLLPGTITGFELLAGLKGDDRTSHIPLVVLTASAWPAERQRAEAAGCDLFLSKPCLPAQLLQALRRLLASTQSPQQQSEQSRGRRCG
jgi:CheY-like chemotaxis protein